MTNQILAETTGPCASPTDVDESPTDLPLVAVRRRESTAQRPLPPAVRFASQSHRARTVRDAERARAIVLFVPTPEPGKLGAAIDADMEAVLASRGAMPASIAEGAPVQAIVADQIHRAAALPVRGVCICLPKLGALAPNGMLTDDDATALSAWMAVAREEKRLRVVVLLDEEDRAVTLRVPVPLATYLDGGSSLERGKSMEAHKTPSPPPAIADTLRPPAPPRFEAELELDTKERRTVAAPMQELAERVQYRVDEGLDEEDLVELREAEAKAQAQREAEQEALRLNAERAEAERLQAERRKAERLEAERLEAERAARLVQTATWRTFAMELDAARGPKPVAAIEKLFAQRYIPLLGAIARGEADAAIDNVVSEWRSSFAESYEASFGSIKVTAKRPPMVMDAPEVAHKVARLASARQVKLILVDSMSFDLGERVSVRIAAALDKRAVLVERSVLWSALPSTTPTQMHLLARGTEGLKDIPGPVSEPEVTRGRTVNAVRRERLGAREILKLDLVEARLRGTGPSYDERLDNIADEVASILVRLFESFPARTLAYVFGDHGFILNAGSNGRGSAPSSQGGASPEEVLVSGQGWLVDAVQ